MWTVIVEDKLPIPKPDPVCFGATKTGRHLLSIPQRAKGYAEWRRACLESGLKLATRSGVLDGPVSVQVEFRLARPKTVKRQDRVWPHVRSGDLDKMCRLLLDAFTDAAVWGDDSQVVELLASKVYADDVRTGARISVWRTTL